MLPVEPCAPVALAAGRTLCAGRTGEAGRARDTCRRAALVAFIATRARRAGLPGAARLSGGTVEGGALGTSRTHFAARARRARGTGRAGVALPAVALSTGQAGE